MKYKAIIFDLDGVICHTDQYHFQAWRYLTERLAIPFDAQINNRLRGVSRMESLDIILKNGGRYYSPEERFVMAEEKNEIYRSLLTQMTQADLPKDTVDTLKTLRARGMRLAIGSSSKNTKLILSRIGLTNFFDAVADGTEIARSKPDPEVFSLAARKLGVEPSDAVVVEDAVAGIRAAKAGGFYAIGIGDAARYEQADSCIDSLSDLLELF